MVETLGYEAFGEWQEISLLPLGAADSSRVGPMGGRKAVTYLAEPPAAQTKARTNAETDALVRTVSTSPVLSTRIRDANDLRVVQGKVPVRRDAASVRARPSSPISTYDAVTFATETVIARGLKLADFKAAEKFGARVIAEGYDGKVLFSVDTVERSFGLVKLLLEREVGSVSPNFLRRFVKVGKSGRQLAWSHAMIGVSAAWAITQGHKDVRIAVLDEGVDTSHPALKTAVVAERDFIGVNGLSAQPDGNDAHGTACAGIAVSRDKTYPGIAPKCSLIAARIGMGDGTPNGWVFDDFATADAIEWAYRDEGAAVLSNSWGGGAPSNEITRAFALASTLGRGGLGSVVVIAAGNDERPIDFPGNLPGHITVGASNPADERKTFFSSDDERWWGSNYGAAMTLLAPGVFISTTDIAGSAGYDPGDFTETFNGTSAATPAVAAAAALMISANSALSAASVRDLLTTTAKMLKGQTAWTAELGFGRLDLAAAVGAALAAGTGTPPPAPPKTPAKKTPAKKTPAKKTTPKPD